MQRNFIFNFITVFLSYCMRGESTDLMDSYSDENCQNEKHKARK